MVDIDELERLLAAATSGDLSTAERHVLSEYVECPMCGGDGEVGATDYCNFDGVALGVQFYGIGHEFGAHEKLWVAARNSLPAILTEIRELRATVATLGDSARAGANVLDAKDTEIRELRAENARLNTDLRRCFGGETHAVRNERVMQKIHDYTENALARAALGEPQ